MACNTDTLIHVEGGFFILKGIKYQKKSSFSGKLGIFCLEANWEYRVIRGAIRLANTLPHKPSLTFECHFVPYHILNVKKHINFEAEMT